VYRRGSGKEWFLANNFVRFLLVWCSTVLALWIVDGVFDSLEFDSFQTMVLSALILAVVNLTIKPVLLLITLPLTIFTLGLAIPLINGLVLVLVSALVPGFTISGFWMGVLCALAISFVSFLVGIATGQAAVRGAVHRGVHVQRSPHRDDSVIDVEAKEKPKDRDRLG
jgi:putative membrane protein